MAIKIKGVGAYLPEKVMKNDDWKAYFDTSDEWIVSHTGIKERHVIADDESTVDLAARAARAALENAGMKIEEIDMIIVATCSPDYIGFPTTANILQRDLGAGNIPSFDIRVACTGFVYGLSIANGFIAADTGVNNVLLVAAEALTRIMDWNDRSTAVLFGDGAGAMILGRSDDGSNSLIDSVLYSKGDEKALVRPGGGTRNPLNPKGVFQEEINKTFLKMDGQSVYQFAVRSIGEVVQSLLDRNHLTLDDIAYIVPHQANRRIIEAVAGRRKWPIEKFFINLDKTANTSAASIPLALNDMVKQGLLKKGMKIILVGFGAGLTWGGALLEW
jgi:3-oxoacyl-[acyl-carrier-protein] synthase-3